MVELRRMPPDLFIRTVQVTAMFMRILNQRALTLLALLMCAGMFGVVVWDPQPWRLAGAAAFAVLVYLPLLRVDAARHAPPAADTPADRGEHRGEVPAEAA